MNNETILKKKEKKCSPHSSHSFQMALQAPPPHRGLSCSHIGDNFSARFSISIFVISPGWELGRQRLPTSVTGDSHDTVL
jgi:hypothetical protein